MSCFGKVAATCYLPGSTMGMHSVVIDIFNAEKIILVAGNPSLPSAPSHCFYRIFANIPVHYIYLMNKLFNYMIARKPAEISPVSQHIFHICTFRVVSLLPIVIPVTDNMGADNFTYLTVCTLRPCFHKIFLNPADCSAYNRKSLLFCPF